MNNVHANFMYGDEYSHMELKCGEVVIRFENNCPVKDHAEYVNFCINQGLLVIEGSSFNHLVMDFDGIKFIGGLNGEVERLVWEDNSNKVLTVSEPVD